MLFLVHPCCLDAIICKIEKIQNLVPPQGYFLFLLENGDLVGGIFEENKIY